MRSSRISTSCARIHGGLGLQQHVLEHAEIGDERTLGLLVARGRQIGDGLLDQGRRAVLSRGPHHEVDLLVDGGVGRAREDAQEVDEVHLEEGVGVRFRLDGSGQEMAGALPRRLPVRFEQGQQLVRGARAGVSPLRSAAAPPGAGP